MVTTFIYLISEFTTEKQCYSNVYDDKQKSQIVHCPIHGNWGEWSTWNNCSATCESGEGVRKRTRSCSNPHPQMGSAMELDGEPIKARPCEGDQKETKKCVADQKDCPFVYEEEWGKWSACNATCGGGYKTPGEAICAS